MSKPCAVARPEFHSHAQPIAVTIDGIPQAALPKEFSTSSLGWFLSGKTTIQVNGKPVIVQIGMNLTIIGSKELPKDQAA